MDDVGDDGDYIRAVSSANVSVIAGPEALNEIYITDLSLGSIAYSV